MLRETQLNLEIRLPFARLHLDGAPGRLLHFLGRRGKSGYRILDNIERILAFLRFIPGGEYWLLRKS